MRSLGWWCAVALVALAGAAAPPAERAELLVTSALVGEDEAAGAAAGPALRELAALVLAARGAAARAVPPPLPACRAPAERACRDAVLRALAAGALHAALLPAPAAAPAPPALRDAGLDLLADAAPPARRLCRAAYPGAPPARAARSLLDLADPDTAALYDVSPAELARAVAAGSDGTEALDWSTYPNDTVSAEACSAGPCATLLTSTASEARALLAGAGPALRVRAVPLGARLAAAAAALPRARLACDALARPAGQPLGPPPCAGAAPCAFEPLRLLKLANVRALAAAPAALRALAALTLDAAQLGALAERAAAAGPRAAAAAFLAEHPGARGAAEVRVSVLLPGATRREGLAARALAAAAALAEQDAPAAPGARFKVELYDDGCEPARAYKHLLDALGTGEYGALTAVAGPACGAAFADVARQSPAHALPVLAYTPQAPPAAAAPLLAAGDARDAAGALGALLARMRWRRLAALTEAGARAVLDPARLRADLVVHTELADDRPDPDYESISRWAERAAAARARVLLVWAQDWRVVRAALCAGRAAGLTPRAGAVWLLPPLEPAALAPARGERCDAAQLAAQAAAHLSVAPAWHAAWAARAPPAGWARRWRRQCARQAAEGACAAPPAAAALLYDALRLWAAALARLLAARPAAADDLHDPEIIRALMSDVVSSNYTGLTGSFEWEGAARAAPMELLQWDNGTHRAVGSWARGAAALALAPGPRWATPGGAPPSDGGEPCALQALADALGADCRVALGALLALLLGALGAALAGAGWLLKRRLERRYRRRLAALGLTALAPEPAAPDRWELPRERVVINRKLGVGAFGTVYGGHALLGERRAWTAVAVKTLKPGADVAAKLDFLAEAEAMKRLDHPNVVRLLGVITQSEPVATVMEFMLYGDLKGYLLARRHLAEGGAGAGEADEVAPRRLTAMALDAARALSYLAQRRFVHRDVAARNCLVSARRGVKLADFGMARPVCESDYYRFSRRGLLPVRWMAPESLLRGVFSPASDVWALGVLLYEIVTFGALPYQGLGNAQVLARVTRGRPLRPPPHLNPSLEGLMKACWQAEPRARPSAAAVAAFLADAPRLLTPCLVPLDALPLDDEPAPPPRAEELAARWVSWAAPPSAATDTTYLSADARDASDAPDAPDTSDTPDTPDTPDAAPETQRFLP